MPIEPYHCPTVLRKSVASCKPQDSNPTMVDTLAEPAISATSVHGSRYCTPLLLRCCAAHTELLRTLPGAHRTSTLLAALRCAPAPDRLTGA